MLYGLIIISSRAKSHPGVDEMHLQAAMMKNRVCVWWECLCSSWGLQLY